MKALFRILKPLIKKLILAQMKQNQDYVVTFLMKKIELPMTGEQEEQLFTVVYDALETIVTEQIEKV
jgi:uncharacterized membrane-anchored protein